MTGEMGKSAQKQAGKLSANEEENLFARADVALESLSQKYQTIIQRQFRDLTWYVGQRRWTEAGNIAHSMGGEAGTFHRPRTGQVAALLRDILQTENPESLHLAIEVLQDGLSFFIGLDAEENSEAATTLLEGLVAVAAKSGIEVSS